MTKSDEDTKEVHYPNRNALPMTDNLIHPTLPTQNSVHQTRTEKSSNALSYVSLHCGNAPQGPYYAPMESNNVKNDDNQTQNTNNPTPPTSTHKYWKLAAAEIHHLCRFLQYNIEIIKLSGYSISHLYQFYEYIRLAYHSSFSKYADI